MINVKLIEPGFDNFTGNMSGIEFEEGVSTEAVSRAQAEQLAAAMRVEFLNGSFKSVAQRILDRDVEAKIEEPSKRQTEDQKAAESVAAAERKELMDNPPFGQVYTVEDLEGIADESGIAGLREIAAEHGIKDRSLGGLIREMIVFQERAGFKIPQPEPEPAPVGEPDLSEE